MNRRTLVKRTVGALSAAGAGCFGYAVGIEPHWLEIVSRELPIDRLPVALRGARLAQVSDLHIGPWVSDAYVVESFDRLRALKPDIVVVTGDFLTYRPARGDGQFDQLGDVLATLPHGRLATFGILGNHDYGVGWREAAVADRVASVAERSGIHMLRNAVKAVEGLDVIGVDDLWARRAAPVAALAARTNDAAIVLVHNPDTADKLPWPGYRGWMLAGHTHGGQCRAPFLPPPLLPVENRRYVAGEVAVDRERKLYISRGVGHLIRARFNVRPEITLFTLREAV